MLNCEYSYDNYMERVPSTSGFQVDSGVNDKEYRRYVRKSGKAAGESLGVLKNGSGVVNYRGVVEKENKWKRIDSNTFYGDSGPHLSKLYTVPDELRNFFEIYDGTDGVLGRGAYSSVFKVRSLRSGNVYALKVMSVEHFTCRGLGNQLRREVQLQSQCYHPNIVQLYKYMEHCGYVFLLLEYVDNNLFSLIHKRKKNQVLDVSSRRNMYSVNEGDRNRNLNQLFSRNEVINYISQLLKAVNYLYEMNIIHRDIKPENILISNENRIKLGDFGWCGDLTRRCSSIAGTFCYMAPEVLKGEKQSIKVDSWSVGIVLYELFVGRVPFIPDNTSSSEDNGNTYQTLSMLKSIREISRETKPSSFPSDAWHLCCWLLRTNSNERASPIQALNHPFLSEGCAIPSILTGSVQNVLSRSSSSSNNMYNCTPEKKREQVISILDLNDRDKKNDKCKVIGYNSSNGASSSASVNGITYTALPLVAVPTPTNRTRFQREHNIKRMSTEIPSFLVSDYRDKSDDSFNISNHRINREMNNKAQCGFIQKQIHGTSIYLSRNIDQGENRKLALAEPKYERMYFNENEWISTKKEGIPPPDFNNKFQKAFQGNKLVYEPVTGSYHNANEYNIISSSEKGSSFHNSSMNERMNGNQNFNSVRYNVNPPIQTPYNTFAQYQDVMLRREMPSRYISQPPVSQKHITNNVSRRNYYVTDISQNMNSVITKDMFLGYRER